MKAYLCIIRCAIPSAKPKEVRLGDIHGVKLSLTHNWVVQRTRGDGPKDRTKLLVGNGKPRLKVVRRELNGKSNHSCNTYIPS